MLLLMLLMVLAPHRIVSVAPSITEILFALGAGDQVVGDTTTATIRKPQRPKRRSAGSQHPASNSFWHSIPTWFSYPTTVRISSRTFSSHTGLKSLRFSQTASPVFTSPLKQSPIRSDLAIAEKCWCSRSTKRFVIMRFTKPTTKKPKVLFVVGRTPGTIGDLIVVGHEAHLLELIDLAGGTNVAGDTTTQYPHFAFEEVIHRDPDIIIDMGQGWQLKRISARSTTLAKISISSRGQE